MPNIRQKLTFSKTFQLVLTENTYFFVCFLIYLLFGAIGILSLSHGDLLVYFSDHRTAFGNTFFSNATKLGEELSYLFFVVFFLFVRFRYALLVPLTGLVVTIISFLTKSFFQQPRPSIYYQELGTLGELNLVEGVKMVKGLTSFPSGHTMSAFALFTLVALLVKRKKGVAILLFLIAVSVGLSRIYLMQHFLRDVYLGSILGVGISVLLYWWQLSYDYDPAKWYDQKLSFPK
ncbi:MAG: phosphatase PAP2 family protein [Bacteroidota bacterium]